MSYPGARTLRWLAGAALAVTAGAGCGSTDRGAQQPSWRRAQEMRAASARGPITVLLAPRDAPARAYNDPPVAPPPHFPLGDAVVEAVDRASAQIGRAAPQPDGRLYQVARQLAEVAPAEGPLVYSLIEFALERAGIIEPSPHLIVIWGPQSGQDILASLEKRLPAILAGSDFVRLGVGVAERENDQEVTILAFQQSAIDTGPIPRQLPPGGSVAIEGTVKRPYADPELFLTREDGAVEQLPLRSVGQGGFKTDMRCGHHTGRQQIEITANDQTGATVLANFPIWCGEDPPPSLTVTIDEDEIAPVTSEAEAEARLARLVNRDRERQGLPPLEIDSRLTDVARKHSQWMRSSGVVAHISPLTGSAVDRVKAAGIHSAVVLENVARAYGIGEAEDGLMNSPGHRANLLSRDVTHMGIGVVLGDDVADRRELFVTQLFIRVPAAIDRGKVTGQVREAVHEARSLAPDAVLDRVAQKLADAVASGTPAADASAVANRELGAMRLPYTTVTTLVTTVADMAAFKPAPSLTDRTIRAYGVGVAQGDNEVMGAGAIHIVLLFGHQ